MKEVIKTLNECGIKKSKIEADLGMPVNSLSGMLSGSRDIPTKWVQPLTDYASKLGNIKYGQEKQPDDMLPLEQAYKPEVNRIAELEALVLEKEVKIKELEEIIKEFKKAAPLTHISLNHKDAINQNTQKQLSPYMQERQKQKTSK